MRAGNPLRGIGCLLFVGMTAIVGCVEGVGVDEHAGSVAQEINGPSSPASQFQLDRAVKIPGCTATRISAQFAITARHCASNVGDVVQFYTSGPGFNQSLTATVAQVIARPGTNASVCQTNMNGCVDTSGLIGVLLASFARRSDHA
jgi:hypothetical protein